MIKNKNLLILAAVLVVLLAISLCQKTSHRKATSGSATATVLAGTFTADQLEPDHPGSGDGRSRRGARRHADRLGGRQRLGRRGQSRDASTPCCATWAICAASSGPRAKRSWRTTAWTPTRR